MPSRVEKIIDKLEGEYPEAQLELVYDSPLKLLVGTILSAQSTDKMANKIAEQLFISSNTVRFHIKNIYSKLDVHRRTEAIDRAKQLELI